MATVPYVCDEAVQILKQVEVEPGTVCYKVQYESGFVEWTSEVDFEEMEEGPEGPPKPPCDCGKCSSCLLRAIWGSAIAESLRMPLPLFRDMLGNSGGLTGKE